MAAAAAAALRHPFTVFLMSMAMVIGPTPPGTFGGKKKNSKNMIEIGLAPDGNKIGKGIYLLQLLE